MDKYKLFRHSVHTLFCCKSRAIKFIMAWSVLLLVVLDLAGLYFNGQMLHVYFKSASKPQVFHQDYRPLVSNQFLYQMSVLTMNSIEVLDVLDIQQVRRMCSFFQILSVCVNITLVSNFITAILIIGLCHHMLTHLSPVLLMLTPLCFGFFGSACFWWCSCFLHEFEYEILAVIFSFVLLLLLLVNLIGHRLLKPSANEQSKSLWGTFKENNYKNLCLLTVWVVICCGAPVIIQVDANTISCWPLFDTMFTLAMNAMVGVIFPLVLIHLFHSIHDENQVINSIVT